MYDHTSISTQALQHKLDRWGFVHPTNLKKEDATCFVLCVYVGAQGSLMCFEIENTEDMKNFGEYWKFQSLKLHSAYLNIF